MIAAKRQIFLVLLLAVLGGAAAAIPGGATWWWVVATTVIVVALIDLFLMYRQTLPLLQREMPGSVSLATWTEVHLLLTNTNASKGLRVQLFDYHPESFQTKDLPLDVTLEANHEMEMHYRVRPTERGVQEFTGCDLRISSPLGLWWRRHHEAVTSVVHVYPNYSTISKLLAFAVDSQQHLSGVRLSRRRGEGIEFHQLRDYREGDSLRSVDWKATARMGRLIAREYQDERDQQVVFLLDAGRRMLAKDEELSHFDHALNAMLLLSYVATRQGDAAGVMAVGRERSWLPPRKGATAINGLLNHVYGIQPDTIEVDYLAAATDLAVKQRRRSLIIILSNVREEDSDELRAATNLLRRKHLVMLASLRETALDESLDKEVHNFDDALLNAATHQYLDERRETHKLLRASGVVVEDCLCSELPAAITNRYLAIKRAGLL